MKPPMLMTPGPTEVSEDVLTAMSRSMINPDLDPVFFEFYRALTRKVARLVGTAHEVLVLGGEGWTLRDFYVGGGLQRYMNCTGVEIVTLERFVALANRGQL